MRGKLPEPASISLAVLSQVYMERCEFELAEKYLTQAVEVDPKPTSSNMPVQCAIQRAKLQILQGKFDEALANIRSIRVFHHHRPSGIWTEQDLIAHEALVCIRMGDITAAERLISESSNTGEHSLSLLARAEILLETGQSDLAEKELHYIVSNFPYGILSEPLMPVRVLLVQALFSQNKIYEALHAMRVAIRLAAPERFFRPFLEGSAACIPGLSLVLKRDTFTTEAHTFIKDLLRIFEQAGNSGQHTQAYIDALSISGSISPREQEILRLMSAGSSIQEIAYKLTISDSTVKTHIGNIYNKFNVNNRIQAVSIAKELNLV